MNCHNSPYSSWQIAIAFTITTFSSFGTPIPVRAATLTGDSQPTYVTAGNPIHYQIPPGTLWDGVAELLLVQPNNRSVLCSGSLLPTRLHILTAAHCLADEQGQLNTRLAQARFQLPTGLTTLNASTFFVHPNYNGQTNQGNDIALIELLNPAPAPIPTYDIYRLSNEVGQVADMVGYGLSGTGNTGIIPRTNGIKRAGKNRYDALSGIFNGIIGINAHPQAGLLYDFDNGRPENDGFGIFGPALGLGNTLADVGLGNLEVIAAPGDSGGPKLINGEIAGISSFSLSLRFHNGTSSDLDNLFNRSFGEFGFDTRVSHYADWIDSITMPSQSVPEPRFGWGFVLLILGSWLSRRKTAKRL